MVLAQLPRHKPTAHDKKRHGHHHKPSKEYGKAYWPYLPMLLIVVLGFVINSTWNSTSGVLGYATNVSATSLLQETNIQRSNNGLGALALNGLLSKAAQEKANDMAARNYWSHTTPEGTQPWQFISAVGYKYTNAGENLAYGFDSSSAALSGWMNSSGHRANVLGASYKEIGFGIANAPDYQGDGPQTIIVAMYAAPQAVAAAPAPSATQPAVPTSTPSRPTPKPAPVPSQPTASPTPTNPPPTQKTPATNKESSTANEQTTPNVQSLAPQTVSRIDVMTDGNAQWAVLVASLIISLGALTFVYRHGRMWRKFIVEGERFIIRHPVLDTAVVAIVVVGILLTGTSGFIH